jgi:carboxyl-terminal processing protease
VADKIVEVKRSRLVIGAIVLVLAAGFIGTRWSTLGFKSQDFSSLNDLQATLERKFDGDVDAQKALDGAKAGLVDSVGDPYTTYLTKAQAKELSDDLKGNLSGIGAEIGFRNKLLSVISPIANTPAAKAGLQPNDVIVKIDGKDPSGLSLEEAVSKIRGKAGTEVTLTIVRDNGQPFDVKITRADIVVPSVTWKKDGDVGIITVSRFGDDTVNKVQEAAKDLESQGATKYVLDLRNNGGGYLQAAVGVSNVFMDNKVVVEERKGGKTTDKLSTSTGGTLVGKPVIVLINGGSASASEITAGALQDQGVAKLVGEKSFGKGSVQEIIDLAGGAQLKVTVAHWFTPKGRGIDKQGIQPDTVVKMTAEDINAGRDPQLDKAKELLNQ